MSGHGEDRYSMWMRRDRRDGRVDETVRRGSRRLLWTGMTCRRDCLEGGEAPATEDTRRVGAEG